MKSEADSRLKEETQRNEVQFSPKAETERNGFRVDEGD
jgi:hypothetical protein